MNTPQDCELCRSPGGPVIWADARLRVIAVDEPGYAGFCRVVWNRHVAEMSDLDTADRAHCMAVVNAVELALREALQPDKINLACLGNMVPHLHWHVIPRFVDDPHFPQPVWAARQRSGPLQRKGCENLHALLKLRLDQAFPGAT
jgi:diadenosine tetraphosphate (Ap4A) HIT family hydrolase